MNIMDLNAFQEEMDYDKEVISLLVSEFSQAISGQLIDMKSMLEKEDFNLIAMEAHSIKGGARNLMTEALEIAVMGVEDAAKNNDKNAINENITNLEFEFNRFKTFITSNHII